MCDVFKCVVVDLTISLVGNKPERASSPVPAGGRLQQTRLPLSYAGCCQHAPDEHILWPLMRQVMEIIAGLYWDLGDPATGVPKSHHS